MIVQPPILDPVTVTEVATSGVTITLPLVLYLLIWGVIVVGAGWVAYRMMKPKAEDNSPLLFWHLRQMPKMEALFALVMLMWFVLLVVVTWKQAMGGDMGPNFDSWLLSLNGLTATAGATYALKRATFKAGAADEEAANV